MSLEISGIQNAKLQEIAKSVDKNNDGKLKRDEYSLFAKAAQEKGVDYKEINETLGMNGFQRWWHDVDKISTDGNDDGKLSFKEGAVSFAKGLIGGIPKAMIKHPIATVVTIGACAGLTALTGGAILPVLTAVGIATGVGMAGVGTYKAITAEKDGDAKQALETMGMGVTTTTLSMLSAGKALNKAEQAGVKSAHVAEDANIFQKSVQAFKAIPEALKMSKNWAMSYIKGTPVNLEFIDGSKQTKVRGKVVNETTADGMFKEYNGNGILVKETLADGSWIRYNENGTIIEQKLPDGTLGEYNDKGLLVKQILPDKTIKEFNEYGLYKESFPNGEYKIYDAEGVLTEGKIIEGNRTTFIKNYEVVSSREDLPNRGYKIYDAEGVLTEGKIIEGNRTTFIKNCEVVSSREELPNGGYKVYDANGIFTEGEIIEGNKTIHYTDGKLVKTVVTDGNCDMVYNPEGKVIGKVSHPYSHITETEQYNSDGTITKIFKNQYAPYEKVSIFDKAGRLIEKNNGYSVHKYYYSPNGKMVAEYFTTEYSHRPSVTRIYDGTADLSAVQKGAIIENHCGIVMEGYEFGKPIPDVPLYSDPKKVIISPDGKWRAYNSKGVNVASWGLPLEEPMPSNLAQFGHEPYSGMTVNGQPVYAVRDFTPSEVEAMKRMGYKEGGGLFAYLYRD